MLLVLIVISFIRNQNYINNLEWAHLFLLEKDRGFKDPEYCIHCLLFIFIRKNGRHNKRKKENSLEGNMGDKTVKKTKKVIRIRTERFTARKSEQLRWTGEK